MNSSYQKNYIDYPVSKMRGVLLASAICAVMIAGCGKSNAEKKNVPVVPEVGYVVLEPQQANMTTELAGRTVAFRTAEVRPQVSGLIRSKLFQEGSDVKAGSPLYQIDSAVYQANLASAQASLNKAQAGVRATALQEQRSKELVVNKAISKQEYDNALASLKQNQADVASAQANLNSQRINLNYTRITAPISGRIGKSTVNEGALVTSNQTDALTTIQQLDPMYVDLSQTSSELLRLRQAIASGSAQGGSSKAKVKLILSDGTPYETTGTLDFSGVSVDQNSDSINLRAVFPNPQHQLLPGMFVRAVLDTVTIPNALLVPQKAVMRDAAGKPMVWVIDADNKIVQRMVTTGSAVNNQWVITEGLQAGDKLVVDGFQKAKIGVVVKGVLVEPSVKTAEPAPSETKKE